MGAKKRDSEAKQYREHLLSVCKYLVRSKPVSTYAKTLASSATTALTQLEGFRPESWELDMQPWSIELHTIDTAVAEGATRPRRGQEQCVELVMGSQVSAAKGALTRHSVPVNVIVGPQCFVHGPPWCTEDAATQVMAIRRFHFDYDANVDKWSRSHLQIGGKPQELSRGGSAYYFAVSEDPSEPRIPFPRYDFVIVLDLMLREFSSRLDKLPSESDWKALVRRSEELLQLRFFEQSLQHLQAGKDTPLADCLDR